MWWASTTSDTLTSPMVNPRISLTITTDASHLGWGAVCADREFGGHWHPDERIYHINWLEMRAVQLGLQLFAADKCQTSIRCEVDNTTTVAYLNHKGGTRSRPLCNLAQEIWEWALSRQLHLVAVHVPGKMNIRADYQSRAIRLSSGDWMLNPELFAQINTRLGPSTIDLSAARHNAQMMPLLQLGTRSLGCRCRCFYASEFVGGCLCVPSVLTGQLVHQDDSRIVIVSGSDRGTCLEAPARTGTQPS